MRSVGPPVTTFFCDLASHCVGDRSLAAHFIGNSLKYADAAPGIVAVSTEMHSVGIWANDGDGLQPVPIKRQQIVFILEEND